MPAEIQLGQTTDEAVAESPPDTNHIAIYSTDVANGIIHLQTSSGSVIVLGGSGSSGSVWRSGAGVPGLDTPGADGDYYINTNTGVVYARTGGTYYLVMSIMGPSGANGADGTDGANGINGSTWKTGVGVLSNTAGINGDCYLDCSTGYVYQKILGVYTHTGTLSAYSVIPISGELYWVPGGKYYTVPNGTVATATISGVVTIDGLLTCDGHLAV